MFFAAHKELLGPCGAVQHHGEVLGRGGKQIRLVPLQIDDSLETVPCADEITVDCTYHCQLRDGERVARVELLRPCSPTCRSFGV